MKRFAVFRKDMQLFEILRLSGPDANPHKIVYEEPLGVSLWHVLRTSAPIQYATTKINGKDAVYTCTGASLRPASNEAVEEIPIVQFLKHGHIPNNIRGVRVLYMDGLNSTYFSKKMQVKPVETTIESTATTTSTTTVPIGPNDSISRGTSILISILIFGFTYYCNNLIIQNSEMDDVCYPWERNSYMVYNFTGL